MFHSKFGFALVVLLALPSPSQAQVQPSSSTTAQAPDASRPVRRNKHADLICQKQEVTGSRLSTKRVCKTRAEWAEFQLQERQEIEKVQVQRGMPGN